MNGLAARGRAIAGNPWGVAVILSIATFMEVLDTAIANVSLRHIAGGLSAGLDESTWVLTSYLVANAIVLPISGWLATTIGRKRFYMICVALFTVSSLLCGLATNLSALIFFRVLQGLGGGGLAPSEQSILADSFPPEKHGQVFALYGVAVVVAPAIGPTLGGWITDNYSWHWIFLINVPVGFLSLFLAGMFVPEEIGPEALRTGKKKKLSIDYLGFALVAIGLGGVQIVLDKGERDDWFSSSLIVWMSVISVAALITLIIRELRCEDPIVDLPLLKIGNFFAANVVMFSVGFILYGTTQLLPQFLQTVLGYTATDAGLAMTPGGFATMASMPIVGILLSRKAQPRYLVAFGLIIEAAALYHMTGFNSGISFQDAMWARIFQAAGLGFLFVPINTVAFVGLPPGKRNNASALINLSRNIGGSFGISLCQTWLSRRSQFHQSRLVEHLTPYNMTYVAALKNFAARLHHQGSGTVAGSDQALGSIYNAVQQQAAMLSYLDVFWTMMLGTLAVILIVFMLRKTEGKVTPGH